MILTRKHKKKILTAFDDLYSWARSNLRPEELNEFNTLLWSDLVSNFPTDLKIGAYESSKYHKGSLLTRLTLGQEVGIAVALGKMGHWVANNDNLSQEEYNMLTSYIYGIAEAISIELFNDMVDEIYRLELRG